MTNTEVLREKIQESGLKLIYIADKLGIDPRTLALKMNGKYEFKQSEIAVMTDLIRLTAEERDRIFFTL